MFKREHPSETGRGRQYSLGKMQHANPEKVSDLLRLFVRFFVGRSQAYDLYQSNFRLLGHRYGGKMIQ